MKRAALGAVVEFEIVEKIVDDLAVVEADLRERPAADLDDLVNVSFAPGVVVVDRSIARVVGLRARNRLDAAQRRLMSVPWRDLGSTTRPLRSIRYMIVEYRGKRPKIDPLGLHRADRRADRRRRGRRRSRASGSARCYAATTGRFASARARRSRTTPWFTSANTAGRSIGDDVTVGHCAVMEDCDIKRYALIGSNATLLNGCMIGEGALIAAGSVVGERAEIPPRVVAAGAPAKVKKALEGEAATWIEISAAEYVQALALVPSAEHRDVRRPEDRMPGERSASKSRASSKTKGTASKCRGR